MNKYPFDILTVTYITGHLSEIKKRCQEYDILTPFWFFFYQITDYRHPHPDWRDYFPWQVSRELP